MSRFFPGKGGGRLRPRSFFELPGKGDMAAILAQSTGRRFDPSLILGPAARCFWGLPSVIACAPLRAGNPFPTTFWLTCPHLVRLCGSLESSGEVARLDVAVACDRSGWTAYNLLHARLRLMLVAAPQAVFLRKYRKSVWDVLRKGGVGGINYSYASGGGAKCLHLHAASLLALGFHPEKDRLDKILTPLYCEIPPAECAEHLKDRKETSHVEG